MGLCFFLAVPAFAGTVVNSEFVITNRKIESATFNSEAPGFNAVDTTGSGLYKMSDFYADAIVDDVMFRWGLNQQPGFKRANSLFSVTMKGEKLGHKFTVMGKYANSKINLQTSEGQGFVRGSFPQPYKNNGCILVVPSSLIINGTTSIDYEITSDSNVNNNCVADTFQADFAWNPQLIMRVTAGKREVYLDLDSLQRDVKYRNAPPDTYTGTEVYRGEAIVSHNGVVHVFPYTNNIKIIKNPYFENVSLPQGDNIFSVKTVGNDVRGDLVIPYVINGHFTPYNRITLNVTSLNDFKLKDQRSHSIPYSLTTGIGSQKEYSLVTSGTSNGSVTITNLTNENYSLQGRFNAGFSIDKSAVAVGDYTDTLTAIFEIAL
ncbi:fimbrial protein [Salmonella enterica]